MKRRILSFLLAASMLLPSMSVMAAENQNYAEVQEASADEVLGVSFNEGKKSAAEIVQDVEVREQLQDSAKEKWYKFTSVDYTSYYTFNYKNVNIGSGAYSYTYFILYDDLGTEIENVGVKSTESDTINIKLDKGREYYLCVCSGDTGNFTFDFSVTEDEADSKEEAGELEANILYKATIGAVGDEDWYTFTSADYTNCSTFSLTNIDLDAGNKPYCNLYVYDEDGIEIAKLTNVRSGDTASVDVKLEESVTYYMQITSGSNLSGKYRFEYDVAKDEADYKEDAEVITAGDTNKAAICVKDDEDWYKFTTKNKDAEYKFTLNSVGVYNCALVVYDEDDLEIVNTDDVYVNESKTVTAELDKNTTYYVRVYSESGHMGMYNFTVKTVTAWPFDDVEEDPGNWKYEAVKYVYEKGIMNGVSKSEFQPDEPLTRAMFATMLYRMSGGPAVTFTNKFADVPAGEWYSNAIIWASNQGIVNGYGNGRFGTNDFITREQIAKMLNEYGKNKGYKVNQSADFTNFADASSVSSWANNYMKWAVGSGMITGKPVDGKLCLEPKASATRAESATMLKRFIEKYN